MGSTVCRHTCTCLLPKNTVGLNDALKKLDRQKGALQDSGEKDGNIGNNFFNKNLLSQFNQICMFPLPPVYPTCFCFSFWQDYSSQEGSTYSPGLTLLWEMPVCDCGVDQHPALG